MDGGESLGHGLCVERQRQRQRQRKRQRQRQGEERLDGEEGSVSHVGGELISSDPRASRFQAVLRN